MEPRGTTRSAVRGSACHRSPAPGYPDEERAVVACIGVVMEEEIEHYRFAVRDLAVLGAG
jgi:hypothetical protein